MSINMSDIHYKTKALEGVLSILLAGLSINNPELVEEVKRVLDENINAEGQPDGFVKALKEVRDSFSNIKVVY